MAAFPHTSTVMATGDGELPVRLHPTAGSRVLTAAATHHLPARSTTAATRQLPARSTAAVAAGPAAVGVLRSPQRWPAASSKLPARLATHVLRGGGGRLPGILSTPGFLSEKR